MGSIAKSLQRALRRSSRSSQFSVPLDRQELSSEGSKPVDSKHAENTFFHTYHPCKSLVKEDFQQILPQTPIKYVCNERYSGLMLHTGNYLVSFYSHEDLTKYSLHIMNYDSKLLSVPFKTEMGRDIPMQNLTNLFPSILPELEDLPAIFRNRTEEEIKGLFKQKLNHLNAMEKTDRKESYQFINHYKYLRSSLDSLNNHMTSSDELDCSVSFRPFSRSQCLIVSNVPYKIEVPRIIDSHLWDLKLYESFPYRRSWTDLTRWRATDVIVFQTPEDASVALKRFNNQHILYNETNPRVKAELL